jgi:hypothetical protein
MPAALQASAVSLQSGLTDEDSNDKPATPGNGYRSDEAGNDASAVGESSSLSDAVAIRKAATPLTATARMKTATIYNGTFYSESELRPATQVFPHFNKNRRSNAAYPS